MPINVLKMRNLNIFILEIQISNFYRAICFLCGMATTGCKPGCLISNVCIMRIMNGTTQLIPLCSTHHIALWSSCGAKHKKYYKGEGGGFPPSLSHGESCESMFASGSSVHQRCPNYALTNLLFGLCKSMWVIVLLVNLFNPHHRASTLPSTLEMLRVREHAPTPSPCVVFIFGLAVGSIKELGGASIILSTDVFKKCQSKSCKIWHWR